MQVAKHKVVTIDYTLTNDEGHVLDSSEGNDPLAYIQGTGNIIKGLEDAMEGRAAGDSFSVRIEPGNAYGERDDALMQKVDREMFQGVEDIQIGMQFHASDGHHTRVVTVVEVSDADVTVDANHPLAGVPLNFDVTVREVREATDEELDHGHVHGPGGHHH